MTDPAQPDPEVTLLQNMLRDELAGTRTTVEIGPFSAMQVVAAIQYTLRHDALPGGYDMAEAAFGSLLNQLDGLLAQYPGALHMIRSQHPPAR
ncbi:hypothetical protein ACFQ1S_05660 [Kibdelosporangium lantanae]|uniref:Uncharacterized protein n=1 Tax=Kibdelosporangium lantanae TaxID=1497396 RepID=A0ABW3M382_9PSEU